MFGMDQSDPVFFAHSPAQTDLLSGEQTFDVDKMLGKDDHRGHTYYAYYHPSRPGKYAEIGREGDDGQTLLLGYTRSIDRV